MDAMFLDRWRQIFRLNLERRSRSAKGQDASGAVAGKKGMILSSTTTPTLAEQVKANSDELIAAVENEVDSRGCLIIVSEWHAMVRHWFDIVNRGLTDPAQYESECAALEQMCQRHEALFLNPPLVFDRRYRSWTPGYLQLQIPPLLIHDCLERFYTALHSRLITCRPGGRETEIVGAMAFADYGMDGVIHPWRDGCGRVSTALVMLLAGRLKLLPLFAETYEGHRGTLGDFGGHYLYFRRCVERAAAYVP